jgi:predicted Zn-dependent protease
MTLKWPEDPAQWRKWAVELRETGHHREACDAFAELHRQQPDNPDMAFQLAISLRAIGDPGAAESHVERVIATRPKKVSAQILHIDLALDHGDLDAALHRVDAALVHQPDALGLRRKRAVVLRRFGRHHEACALFIKLHAENPDNLDMAFQLAISLRAIGDPDAAESHVERVIAATPKKSLAQRLYVDLALDRSNPEAALQRVDAALNHKPNDVVLQRKRAGVLRRLGRHHDACTVFAALHAENPDNPDLAFQLATSLRTTGQREQAEAHVERLIAERPKNVSAQGLYVDLALDRSDLEAALQRVDAALIHQPNDVGLRGKRATVLQRSGRHHDACEVFETLLQEHPKNAHFVSDLVSELMSTGETERAEALCRQVLEHNPDSWPARRSLAMLAEASGDLDAAIAILEEQPECLAPVHRQRTPGDLRVFLAQRLAVIPVRIKGGDTVGAQDWLEELTAHLADLSEGQLIQLIDLAKHLHKWAMLSEVIRQVQTRKQIGTPLALAVLQIGRAAENDTLLDRLVDGLATRIRRTDQLIFRSEAAQVLRSPFDALAELRAAPHPERSAREATVLGRIMVSCGKTHLAVRYLRLCARKWPHMQPITSQLVQAYIASGDPEAGLAFLEARAGSLAPEVYDRLRMQLLIALGRMTEAFTITQKQRQAGSVQAGNLWHLRLLLFMGHLPEAMEEAQALNRNPRQSGHNAAHFRPSHLGTLLTELQLFNLVAPPDGKSRTHHEIVRNNFFAARAVLQDTLGAPTVAASDRTGAQIPRRVVQYWDHPEPPEEIRTIMHSWRSVPGWDYLLHDKRSARRWLRERFGPRHAQAFLRARHVAEESDFLRLCMLLDGGGIYADADDYLKADPQQLLAHGSGLVVFLEPYGAIMNNVICASPGHPAIAHAVNMTMVALLKGDNDNTWGKTGPGLLTRAVALHFAQAPEQARRDTLLLTESELRRVISPHIKLPYKTTAQYWNSTTTRMNDHGIIGALEDITTPTGQAQPVPRYS